MGWTISNEISHAGVVEFLSSSGIVGSSVLGKMSNERKLTITWGITANGVIFSDGIDENFLSFDFGAVAAIKLAEKPCRLVKG